MATPEVSSGQEANKNRRGDVANASASAQLLALHKHLTKALLKPVCPDIRLKAFHRIYSLHRIFLVQSTFFNSLLNSDFKEAKAKTGVWKRETALNKDGDDEDDAVELHFDDPNITRPAFEFCLATLYGAAPTLVLPSWCCPSFDSPLTTQFQVDQSNLSFKSPTFSSTSATESSSKAQHPATPRFLLSLIASAIYLGIPSVASQAVTLILCSITPYTVSQYLRFSLGQGILGAQEAQEREGGRHSHWDWELEGPLWGLEGLSEECSAIQSSFSSILERTEALSVQDDEEDDDEGKAGSDQSRTSSPSMKGAKESRAESFLPSFMSEKDNLLSLQGSFYYGVHSDKIGEVCACWLLRWGAEVLLAEEQMLGDEESPSYVASFTLPRNVLPVPQSLTPGEDVHCNIVNALNPPQPTVWCHAKLGGIPAIWARIIISSDSFWIRSEWDRYDVARRVIAMRRGHRDDFVEADEDVVEEEGEEEMSESEVHQDNEEDVKSEKESRPSRAASNADGSGPSLPGSIEDEDEEEYLLLFAEGIYYTHMTFEELSAISDQNCPSRGSTYVPMNVLQSALWAQSQLKNMISSKDKGKAETSAVSPDDDAEEGSSSSKKPSKNSHPERELGLVSPEEEFGKAFVNVQRKGRKSDSSSHASSTVLGGMRPVMSLGASSKTRALEKLLDKRYFAVPSDDTVRIGENLSSLVNNAAADANSILGTDSTDSEEAGGPSGLAAVIDNQTLNIVHDSKRSTATEYFGVENAVISGRELGLEYSRRSPMHSSRDWTGYEPMRLGAEFFGVDRLKEKERMYSPSFFYAGSIWNLYLQIIKKPKGLQLGIYLHRQNCNDSLPNPGFPSDTNPEFMDMHGNAVEPQTPPPPRQGANPAAGLTSGLFYTSSNPATPTGAGTTIDGLLTPGQQQQTRTARTAPASNTRLRSTLSTPFQGSTSLAPSPTSNCIVNNNNQSPQYLDQRRILRAYFSIHCPSPLGTSLTKFSSRPDNFSLSQSWGWKSSSLLGAVYLSDNRIGSAESQISPIFRCIVTVGVV